MYKTFQGAPLYSTLPSALFSILLTTKTAGEGNFNLNPKIRNITHFAKAFGQAVSSEIRFLAGKKWLELTFVP